MKYVEDLETGELFPVPDDDEIYNEMPSLYKDDSDPKPKKNYSVESDTKQNLVDLIFNLQDELRVEKDKKTVYHKYPILKILCGFLASVIIFVGGFFAFRFVKSVDFEPVSVSYESESNSDPAVSEEVRPYVYSDEEDTASEEEDLTIENFFAKILPICIKILGVSFVILGIRFGTKLLRSSLY